MVPPLPYVKQRQRRVRKRAVLPLLPRIGERRTRLLHPRLNALVPLKPNVARQLLVQMRRI